jgi:hypothetical protein
MPAYYFALEGYHAGEKPDPATDALISLQYQKIDLATGEPLEKLTILAAWESSEKDIVTLFYHQFLRPELPVTRFIPVGMHLDYAFEMLIAKCRQYNLPGVTSYRLYYQRPRFDLAPVIVLLNDGRFAGASVDAFSAKKSDADRINRWYAGQGFKRIGQTLQDEAESFLKLLQYLSRYKTRLGIARKGGAVPRKSEYTPLARPEKAGTSRPESLAAAGETPEDRAAPRRPGHTPPARPEKAVTSRQESPAPSQEKTKNRADPGTPAPGKRPAQIAKAPAPSPGKSREGTGSGDRRSLRPLSQFRKHTPTKKRAAKRD